MRYRVYLWLGEASVAAEVLQDVQASSPNDALLQVMEQHAVSYVNCAWVISPDDDTVDARSEHIFLMSIDDFEPVGGLPEVLYVC